MTFFSDRENGERSRDRDEIDDVTWGGLQALIRSRVEDGSFGASFPAMCPDGQGPIGTDETSFWQVMRSEIPNLHDRPWDTTATALPTLDALDTIEFCWRSIGKPVQGSHHSHFGHYHLRYEIDIGRAGFRAAINRILRRNGLVYELGPDGLIVRLAPPVLTDELSRASFRSGDSELDHLLEKSRRKFLDPDLVVRREALEALWDAWERLKTLFGTDKKTSITAILDAAAGPNSPRLRSALEQEAVALTQLGNNLRIRHSETDREPIATHDHVDYLYQRLFALILAILRAIGRHSSRSIL